MMNLLLGKPLASAEEKAERVGPLKGIPIFGLDALSSAAYGPEAALTLLIPLGMVGIAYIVPITISILILLTIVYFSYQQTIAAYPQGGGSYTVASENLGVWPGLLAAAALMVDYVLTAAVGISAGVGALISAVPEWHAHTLPICLAILVLLTIVNLRGASEAGAIFLLPTYLFIACLLGVIGLGIFQSLLAGGHPVPIINPPSLKGTAAAMSAWLLLRAFSSGCTAMTGVEAVSNGVMAFKEPTEKYARRTLTIIICILMVMLGGIAYLVRAYHIGATEPGIEGYESVLSQLIGAVAGRGEFYWVSMASIVVVLALSANTAFADFPRLARAISNDGFLPNTLKLRGRRLVYGQGVYVLALLTGLLLIIFNGVTDRLIPLYAVGAFLAFTLSQAGMVVHWKKAGGKGSQKSMLLNGLGAFATGATVIVVLVAKFTEGAWITVLLIPTMILFMYGVKRHYDQVAKQTLLDRPAAFSELRTPFVIVPIKHWDMIGERALRYAVSLSKDVQAIHVDSGDGGEGLLSRWPNLVEEPAIAAGLKVPELTIVPSPFRYVVQPIVDYVLELAEKYPDRDFAVLIPELVESKWYYYGLHNNRSQALKAMLLLHGNDRVTVVNIPWYLQDRAQSSEHPLIAGKTTNNRAG